MALARTVEVRMDSDFNQPVNTGATSVQKLKVDFHLLTAE